MIPAMSVEFSTWIFCSLVSFTLMRALVLHPVVVRYAANAGCCLTDWNLRLSENSIERGLFQLGIRGLRKGVKQLGVADFVKRNPADFESAAFALLDLQTVAKKS